VTPLEAALAVANDLGLAVETPQVISEGFNLIVHLAPHPIVARVPKLVDDAEAARTRLERDLRVSAHAARHGAPVVAPTNVVMPGPHAQPGWFVGLFDHAVHDAGVAADPESVGTSLRALHDALAGYTGELAAFDPLTEPVRLLMQAGESNEVSFLREIHGALEVPDGSGQALHGDASYRNVLMTPDGPRWIDLESAMRGPVEWDLAEVVMAVRAFDRPVDEGERALAAYGPHDPELLALMVDLRAFQHACFIVWYEHSRGARRGRAAGFIEWLSQSESRQGRRDRHR
jgi:hypothetical protein